MATSNFKIFDENKSNMMADEEYGTNTQRVNGVQTGVASSALQNKTLYQTSLIAYAIVQMMNANGLDANDTAAVSTFVNNLSASVLQKVIDKASKQEAITGTNNTKWMSPALVKAAFDKFWSDTYNNLVLPVSKGGTGLTSAPSLLVNLASTTAVSPFKASPRPGVTGTLPVERGGTGQTNISSLVTMLANNGIARSQSGSYVGTGTYDSSNPCSITFSFKPKIVIFPNNTVYNARGRSMIAVDCLTTSYQDVDGTLGYKVDAKFDTTTNTLYWYSYENASHQLNVAGKTYYWVAIG